MKHGIIGLFLGAAVWPLLLGGVAYATQVVGSTPLTVTAATLNQITVTAPSASIPVGVPQAFTATGAYSDGSSRDLTDLVTWSSSAPSIASVTAEGVVTAVQSSAVPVQIIASHDGRAGAKSVTVNPATLNQITVTAPLSTIPRGASQTYVATGAYSNGSSFDLTDLVTWSSSAPSIATVTADGVALGVQSNAVPVQIIASHGGRAGAANLIVNAAALSQIAVNAPAATIPRGISQAYTATGIYSNGSTFDLTDLVTWSSSAPSIASITDEGVATGVQPNAVPVQIIASYDGRAGGANLTVNAAILTQLTVTAPASTLPRGVAQPYTATGTYSNGTSFDLTDLVTWSSSAPSIASVTAEGLATGIQAQASPINIVASLTVNRAPTAVLQATPTSGFAPLTVSFNGGQSFDPDGDSIVRYVFTFGDGSGAAAITTPTISHLYPAAGTYVATLVVRDVQGNDSSSTAVQIVVNPNRAPTAVLQATPTSGFAPLTVSFNGGQSFDPDGDSIVRYVFTFGDGSVPIAQTTPTVSHLYPAAGTYVATLVVRDVQGNDSSSTAVQIVVNPNRAPTAVLQATPTTGNSPLTVNFSGAQSFDPDGDRIVRYVFTFGDGAVPIAQTTPTISHVYGAPGTFVATLTVRDVQGNDSSPVSVHIVVPNHTPTAVLQATPATGFAPLSVSFNGGQSFDPDAGDRIVRYVFTFGDGSAPAAITTPTISHLYPAPGTYVATLVVRDSLGDDGSPVSVQVVVSPNRRPFAVLQATPTSGIVPLTVSFTGAQSSDPDGDSIVRYTFTFGDGSPPVAQPSPTLSRVYSAPGTYVASLTVRDLQGNDSSPVSVQIVVSNAIAIGDATVTEGNSGTGKAVFTVTLAAPSSQTVTVRYATRDGVALAGKDYVGTTGTLTFPASVTSQTITVGILGELLFEGNETFFVDLSAPVNAVITRPTGRGVVVNDDPSVGETAMTPAQLGVAVGERTTLSVTWTHPISWRELQTIDVRIVDDEDIALWVRFQHDQVTDAVSVSVFNPASGRFGHAAAPGGPQRFESAMATLYLDESAVLGPPGTTVTLNLRLSMKPRAAGRVFRVEVFATDDVGHQQGFDPVGTLTVRR